MFKPANIQAFSTVILMLVTGYYAYVTHNTLKESRKDKKREEILRLLAFGVYPIWNALLSHKKDWEKEKYRENEPQFPFLIWPKIPEDLSFRDVSSETNYKNLSEDISNYNSIRLDYDSKRRDLEGEIKNIIESKAFCEWINSEVNSNDELNRILEENDHYFHSWILKNEVYEDDEKYEYFQMIEDELFDILEYDSISESVAELECLQSVLQENHNSLLTELKMSSRQLKDKYSIINTTIHNYRNENMSKTTFRGSTNFKSLSYLWRWFDDYYPP